MPFHSSLHRTRSNYRLFSPPLPYVLDSPISLMRLNLRNEDSFVSLTPQVKEEIMTDRPNTGEPNGPEQFGTEQSRSRLSEFGGKVREKAGEFGNTAKEAVNQGRQSAANALESAGSRLHETADRGIPGSARVS